MFGVAGWILSLWVVCVHGVSRPPIITTEPHFDVYYKPRETVELPCNGTGEPRPSFTWTRNEEDFNPSGNDARVVQLANAGTLVFNSPEEKDEGIFQCSAKNDFGVATTININMRVAKLKKFDPVPDIHHTAELGMPYTLPCVPPESIPPAQVFWIIRHKMEGSFVAVSYNARVTMDREYNLRFINIEAQDAYKDHAYACMAVNNVMRDNAQGPLHFISVTGNAAGYQPAGHMWSDQDDRFGLRGENLTVKCIFSGNPTPDVHWVRTDNKTLSKRTHFISFSQELLIENLQYEDAGSYECWANNVASGGRRVTRTFNIQVNSKPVFLQRPKSVETGIGNTVQFHCRADGQPPAAIRWFINGVSLADSTDPRKNSPRFKTIGGNIIQMEQVEKTDFMVFQCNASNKHGYVFANAYLNVLSEAPEIITPPLERLVSAEGVSVNLTCRVTGKPDPIITWYKDGVQVTGGRYQILGNGDLHIDYVVLADAGLYICEAQNRFNTTSEKGVLVVRRKTRIEQKPGDLERNAGMDAKFTCSGVTDPEEVDNLRILWLKDGKEITANDQRMMTNFQDNSLTISGTITRDSGTYTCVATNGLDSTKASAVLTVKDRPDPPLDVYHEDCNKYVIVQWMPGSYNNAPIQYYVVQYNTTFNPNQWKFIEKVNASINKVNLTLSPYVNYTFRVIAYNKIGPSDPSQHTPDVCTTKDAPPDAHPKNLRTIGDQPNTLFIEWTPIPQYQHNAAGFMYSLEILRVGDSVETGRTIVPLNWMNNTYQKNTGMPYERYKITVKASNNIGDAKGDPTSIIGHSYETIPVIEPTDFQALSVKDTSAELQWDFDRNEIKKVDTKIRGEFRGFKIQFWEENNQALTIRESDIGPEILSNSTGNTFKAVVTDMLPNTPMKARISVKNNFYVGRPSEVIRFHTEAGFPGPVDFLGITNTGDTHVNLEWGVLKEAHGGLEGYDISYQLVNGLDLGEMQDREPQLNDPYRTNAILSGLQPNQKYRVHIFARTQKGRGEGYFIEFVTHKPGYPRMPRFRVIDVGEHFINISWFLDARVKSGSVIFVEYRKLDGAEWLRTSDEVVNTWKNISSLEPGTTYELRIKATNGARSVSSTIAEVTTDGTAVAYALVGNIGWFLGMFFSIVLLIALIVFFVLAYKRGFRLDHDSGNDFTHNTSAAYSGTYDNTAQMDQGSDRFGAEPKGYNNDYYDDKDYHNYDYDENRPPSYVSDNSYNNDNHKPPPPGDYEDYNRKPSRDYDDRHGDDYNRNVPSAPVDDYYGRGGDYDRRDNDYSDRHDDRYYDRRNDDYYDRRDDDYYRGRDDDYDDRRDNAYGRDRYDDRDYDKKGYDYDSDEPPRRAPSSQAINGNASSTVV